MKGIQGKVIAGIVTRREDGKDFKDVTDRTMFCLLLRNRYLVKLNLQTHNGPCCVIGSRW